MSLICQLTLEDIKQHYLPASIPPSPRLPVPNKPCLLNLLKGGEQRDRANAATVHFRSVQIRDCSLGKAHVRSTTSVQSQDCPIGKSHVRFAVVSQKFPECCWESWVCVQTSSCHFQPVCDLKKIKNVSTSPANNRLVPEAKISTEKSTLQLRF